MKPEELQSIKDGIAYANAKKEYYESLISKYQALCTHSVIEGAVYIPDVEYYEYNDSYISWNCCICGYGEIVGSDDHKEEYDALLNRDGIIRE